MGNPQRPASCWRHQTYTPEISGVDLPLIQPWVSWANIHICVRQEESWPAQRGDWDPVSLHLPVVRNRILLTAQCNQTKAPRRQRWAAWEPRAETCHTCRKPSHHWSQKSWRKYLRGEKTRKEHINFSVSYRFALSSVIIWIEREVLNMFGLWKPTLLLHF